MRMMDVDKLKPHPKNNYFFDDIEGEPWVAFLESIETSGVIEPIIVSAPDLTIVSGHQRVRACKKLGIKQAAVEERTFDSEDEILKQLIETNIRQRGIGNANPVKFGRCIAELERIYGIKNGGDRVSESRTTNGPSGQKTQADLAEDLGVDKKTLQRAKKLAELPEDIQQMVMDGKVTASTASRVIARLTPEEQKQLAEQISGKDKVSNKEVEAEIEKLREENKRLKDDNKILAKRSEPTVIEKTVEVEVAPSDYKEVKNKAKAYDAETKRLNDKLEEAYQKRNELESKIKELEEQTAKEQAHGDMVASAIYFIAQCGSFIRDVGGYVWLADKIADLPTRESEGYIKAAMAVRDWANVLIQNIERDEYGKQEISRISLESIKE
jgi:ParB family chromosome partitioning protein